MKEIKVERQTFHTEPPEDNKQQTTTQVTIPTTSNNFSYIFYSSQIRRMPQSNDIVNLWTYFDEWTRCCSTSYQKDSLYRFGNFDSCGPQYQDLRIAIKAKLLKDEEEAKIIIAETHYKMNLGSDPKNSTTAGAIWELKEKPGWDVE